MGSVPPLLSFLLMIAAGWVHRQQMILIVLWTGRGLVTRYLLFVISLAVHSISAAPCASHSKDTERPFVAFGVCGRNAPEGVIPRQSASLLSQTACRESILVGEDAPIH